MTDISIGAGFVAPQTVQSSASSLPVGSDSSGNSFMQSLQQSGTVDMGQSTGSAGGSVSTAAGNNSGGAGKGVNTDGSAASSGGSSTAYDTSAANDTANAYDPVQNGAYAPSGNVKISEEAVKELNDLTSDLTGGIAAEEEKPLPQQAQEALENAMLKALQDLHDPDKKQEELEEKALMFLMKLVDKINGKSDKKTALSKDEDEDEEQVDGSLLQIIDNMLESVREDNAEDVREKTVVGALKDELIGETNLLDISLGGNTARDKLKASDKVFVREQYDDGMFRDNYRLPDPMAPRVESVGTEQELQTDGLAPDLFYVPTEDSESTYGAEAAAGYDGVNAEKPAEVSLKYISATDSAVGFEQTARIENTVTVTAPVTEQAVTADESRSYGASDFARLNEKTADPHVENAFAGLEQSVEIENAVHTEETVVGQEISQPAAEDLSGLSGEESIANPQISDRAAENPEVLQTAADEEYDRIAEDVYRQVTQTVKAAVGSDNSRKSGNASLKLDAFETRTEPEDEFEELTRLFGVNRRQSGSGLSDKDSAEADRLAKRTEDMGVPIESIRTVSSKTAEVPLAKAFELSESGVKQIVTQIVSEILNNLPEENGETTLMMTLNPESLGRISVKLVENAGKISVTITAENKETAALLASRAENMQSGMRDSGTQLEKYQVVYGAEQDGRAEQQNYEGSSKNPYVREVEEHDEDNEGQFADILRSEAV